MLEWNPLVGRGGSFSHRSVVVGNARRSRKTWNRSHRRYPLQEKKKRNKRSNRNLWPRSPDHLRQKTKKIENFYSHSLYRTPLYFWGNGPVVWREKKKNWNVPWWPKWCVARRIPNGSCPFFISVTSGSGSTWKIGSLKEPVQMKVTSMFSFFSFRFSFFFFGR